MLKPKLVIKQDKVIDGFCWAYCDALLRKLRNLKSEDRIFQSGEEKASISRTPSNLTAIAYNVIFEISGQITLKMGVQESLYPVDIKEILSIGQEVLGIFKETKISENELSGDIRQIIFNSHNIDKSAIEIIAILKSKYHLF